MDNKALAETMTDLYADIESHYEKKTSGRPTAEQTNTIFIECAKIIMTDMINKRPQGVPTQKEGKPKSDTKCIECGNLLTVGEKKYCDDSDKQYRCYRCTHKND